MVMDRDLAEPRTTDRPLVSVIIPVWNDATGLARCLSGLRSQSYPASHLELIVVDNGSSDGSYELAKTFAQRAATIGEPRSWSVIAAAWDRSLIGRGLPQRFGTQFIRENGRWSLGRVDPRVSDAQRALYGVPPLWVQQQNVDQLQQRDEDK